MNLLTLLEMKVKVFHHPFSPNLDPADEPFLFTLQELQIEVLSSPILIHNHDHQHHFLNLDTT